MQTSNFTKNEKPDSPHFRKFLRSPIALGTIVTGLPKLFFGNKSKNQVHFHTRRVPDPITPVSGVTLTINFPSKNKITYNFKMAQKIK